MRFLAGVFLIGTGLFAADVVPRCGGPKVDIQKPGDECGAHGSKWIGKCEAPARCMSVRNQGSICTTPCSSDDECARQRAGLRCTGNSEPAGPEPEGKVCSMRSLL